MEDKEIEKLLRKSVKEISLKDFSERRSNILGRINEAAQYKVLEDKIVQSPSLTEKL